LLGLLLGVCGIAQVDEIKVNAFDFRAADIRPAKIRLASP